MNPLKPIDFLNAAFAAGEMPGSEGLVDHDAATRLGYRIASREDSAGVVPEPQSDGAPSEDVPPTTGSEWGVTVVRIVGFEWIEGADSIEVARFSFSDTGEELFTAEYPVVVRKASYAVGDKAVYAPLDTVLPDAPEFSFLGSDIRRIRAKRLRGVYSEGLLVPWHDFASIVSRTVPDSFGDDAKERADKTAEALDEVLPVGAEVSSLLGAGRYVGRVPFFMGGKSIGPRSTGPDDSVFPYYTVSNARKGEGIQYLSGDSRVIVTEKLHGANIRFGYVAAGEVAGGDTSRPRFCLGSHRTMRDTSQLDNSAAPLDWFQKTAQQHDLAIATESQPGLIFYGEVLGVQDLTYGWNANCPGIRIFDVYNANSERWMHWSDIVEACRMAELTTVPVLYDGRLDECKYQEMAEGKTCMDGVGHVREGVVIRTFAGGGPTRRWKFIGQGYKLRKGQKDLVAE